MNGGAWWPAMTAASFLWWLFCVFMAGFAWHAGSWLFGRITSPRAAS